MSTNVPKVSYAVKLNSLSTYQGARLRGAFTFVCLLPIFMAFDVNGGITKLGFTG